MDNNTFQNNDQVDNKTISVTSKILSDGKLAEQLSEIPELEVPDFKMSPEAELLIMQSSSNKASTDDTKNMFAYIIKRMDYLCNHAEWTTHVLIDTNKQVRKTNGKVIALKAWNQTYGNDVIESLDKVEKHDSVLNKTNFLKDVAYKILIGLAGAATGILAWSELFAHFSK